MPAFNQDNGRRDGRGREARRQAMATGERKPPVARVYVKNYGTGETADERRERHARETGTRRSLWL